MNELNYIVVSGSGPFLRDRINSKSLLSKFLLPGFFRKELPKNSGFKLFMSNMSSFFMDASVIQ